MQVSLLIQQDKAIAEIGKEESVKKQLVFKTECQKK